MRALLISYLLAIALLGIVGELFPGSWHVLSAAVVVLLVLAWRPGRLIGARWHADALFACGIVALLLGQEILGLLVGLACVALLQTRRREASVGVIVLLALSQLVHARLVRAPPWIVLSALVLFVPVVYRLLDASRVEWERMLVHRRTFFLGICGVWILLVTLELATQVPGVLFPRITPIAIASSAGMALSIVLPVFLWRKVSQHRTTGTLPDWPAVAIAVVSGVLVAAALAPVAVLVPREDAVGIHLVPVGIDGGWVIPALVAVVLFGAGIAHDRVRRVLMVVPFFGIVAWLLWCAFMLFQSIFLVHLSHVWIELAVGAWGVWPALSGIALALFVVFSAVALLYELWRD